MTVEPLTVSQQEQEHSDLLVSAISTYLQPLLDKHNSQHTSSVLVYEDLTGSWQKLELYLQSHRTSNNSEECINVWKHLNDLHKSQIAAYRDAAIRSLHEFATTIELPSCNVKEKEGQDAYIQRCCKYVHDNRPNWRVGTGILERNVGSMVRHRAKAFYEQQELNAVGESTVKTSQLQASRTNDNEVENEQTKEQEKEEGGKKELEEGEMDGNEDLEEAREIKSEFDEKEGIGDESNLNESNKVKVSGLKEKIMKKKKSVIKADKSASIKTAIRKKKLVDANSKSPVQTRLRRNCVGDKAVTSKP